MKSIKSSDSEIPRLSGRVVLQLQSCVAGSLRYTFRPDDASKVGATAFDPHALIDPGHPLSTTVFGVVVRNGLMELRNEFLG